MTVSKMHDRVSSLLSVTLMIVMLSSCAATNSLPHNEQEAAKGFTLGLGKPINPHFTNEPFTYEASAPVLSHQMHIERVVLSKTGSTPQIEVTLSKPTGTQDHAKYEKISLQVLFLKTQYVPNNPKDISVSGELDMQMRGEQGAWWTYMGGPLMRGRKECGYLVTVSRAPSLWPNSESQFTLPLDPSHPFMENLVKQIRTDAGELFLTFVTFGLDGNSFVSLSDTQQLIIQPDSFASSSGTLSPQPPASSANAVPDAAAITAAHIRADLAAAENKTTNGAPESPESRMLEVLHGYQIGVTTQKQCMDDITAGSWDMNLGGMGMEVLSGKVTLSMSVGIGGRDVCDLVFEGDNPQQAGTGKTPDFGKFLLKEITFKS